MLVPNKKKSLETFSSQDLAKTAGFESVIYPEFATYEMRNPKPGKGLGCFMA